MAKKKKEVELKEVSRTKINGAIIIKYEDGSVKTIPAPIMLSAEEVEDLFGSESDSEEEEEEESDDDDDDDDDEDDIEKLRKAIAKELGLKLPAKKKAKGKDKKGKK